MEGIDGQVIFLILFVVIGAIKWILEKIKGPEEPHDISDTLEDLYEDFREEIRQRQTQAEQESQSPPPLPPQTVQAPQPAPQTVHTPSTPPASAKLEHYKVKKTNLSADEKAALERFQNMGSRGKKRKRRAATNSIREMLASPESARKAIILKEVLGEPRSMQQI